MTTYLIKWAVAAFVMPLLVLLFGKALNSILVIILWPSSIVLMSLGAEKRPFIEVVYVWGVGIFLNVLLYILF